MTASTLPPPVLAHTGHVLIDGAIYLGPVVAIGLWVALDGRRQRRKNAGHAERRDG
jgi:hypothetical protein